MDTNYSDYGPREQYKMILLWISFEGRSKAFHTSASLAAEKDSSSNWPSDWLWIWSWYIGLVWHASGDTRHWPLPDIRIKSLWPTSGIRHSEDDSEEAGRRDAGQRQGQSGLQAHLPHLPPSLNVTYCMFWNCWSWNEFKCWFSLVSEGGEGPYCLLCLFSWHQTKSTYIVAFKLEDCLVPINLDWINFCSYNQIH